ncbi:aldehyde dehydrogenase (plasmid) [Xanthobacter versatilis]|uniref:Aldehyde dehydrogenase n=1 Tax=Xanthobacter autotrophicus (strain ATCC BAA-1158 / Py2) TaxID=78245 RepID=A7IPX8_XANP2|nr:aldehyde dehydrogenase [Xanthobacter autotrophicus Py2]
MTDMIEASRFDELAERNFIGGEWVFTREGYEFDIYDPSNSTVIAEIPLSTHRDITAVMEAAGAASGKWTKLPATARVSALQATLDYLVLRADHVTHIIARDTGLPAPLARQDLEAAIAAARLQLDPAGAKTTAAPGIIAQILSWSGPLGIALTRLFADLAGGDVAVVKPSLRAPLSLVCLAEAFEAACPVGGVFNIVQGAGIDVGMALARQSGLKRVDFQGSRKTAGMVKLSPARHGIPVETHLRHVATMALGPKDDLDAAASAIAEILFAHAARAGHGGLEVSVPEKRIVALADALAPLLKRADYGVGDGRNVAPFIADKFRTQCEANLGAWRAAGAEVLCAAPKPDARTRRMGWFVPPQLLLDREGRVALDPDRPNGPVAVVRPA